MNEKTPNAEGGDSVYDLYEAGLPVGEWFDIDATGLRPPEPPKTFTEQLTGDVPPMRGADISAMRTNLLCGMHFRERFAKSTIENDLVGLVRHLPDGIETYSDKLAHERQKGKAESAAFGLGKVGEHEVVVYAMDWDFFAGSFGVVAGEKFQMAADLAKKKSLPMISIYSSSGVRQHENYAGLLQMPRALYAQETHKSKTNQPHISLLAGQVWGGISASIVPMGDLILALPGTEYGFTGPNVIEAYEGKSVEPGFQRVEPHLARRNVDVIINDEAQALDYLGRLLNVAKTERHSKISPEHTKGIVVPDSSEAPAFDFGKQGVSPVRLNAQPHQPHETSEAGADLSGAQPTPEELYERYERIARDGSMPDPEFFMQHVLTDVVPFYESYAVDRIKMYPAIIAGVGQIGVQSFLAIGSQPSYQESYDGGMRRIPASPAPKDFKYLNRMLDLGERWKLPAIFFADTLGAKPTLDAEEDDQMRWIAQTILRELKYKQPVITMVTGALGSGGGLAVAPNADHFMMLENSLAFVAEPRSAASILYRTAEPTREQIMNTLASMSATAQDQLRLGLSDETVPEAESPHQAAAFVHDAIVRAYVSLQELSPRQLHGRRSRRIRSSKGLNVNHRH